MTNMISPQEQKELLRSAKFEESELDFINKISKAAFENDDRPLVLLAICSSIMGNIVNMSEGLFTKELVADLVVNGMEV